MTKILEIENLTVSFDGFKALNNLSFSMDLGELRVIIGPNGAGKTTFLDVITGKVKPTIGQVRFKGQNLRRYAEHEIAQLGIGRKFQTPRVYLNLTPRENLELSCNRYKGVFSTLFRQTPKPERQTVRGLLETIGLIAKADIPAQLLSHGEKQWLEIGMLLAQSPDLLLVDEPVAGLTDEETERTGDLLLALAESHSIIVIEHDMEFVRQIARRVTVLHEGSVLYEGTMDQVQNDPRVIEVYLGQSPSLEASQITVLRIAAAMAWADSNFAPVEQEVILTRLSRQFASDLSRQQELRQELQNYLAKNVPLTDLVPQLQNLEDQKQALRLSYEVIRANLIDERESVLYEELCQLLGLPEAIVAQIEAEVDETYQGYNLSLRPEQMTILQIAASMAWADGRFGAEELEVILDRLCQAFSQNPNHADVLRRELPNHLLNHIPLETLVPKLNNPDDRAFALRLSYEVIWADDEMDELEKVAYRHLATLLDLPETLVKQIETEVRGKI